MASQVTGGKPGSEVINKGKFGADNKLLVPSKIRTLLWLQHKEDVVQTFVDTINKRVYIQKKDPHQIDEEEGELDREGPLISGKYLYLTASTRDKLWLELNDYVEYLTDPDNKHRFFIRRRE